MGAKVNKCRKEIASTLNDFGDRGCKREHVEPHALQACKVSIFKIVDKRINFYSQNTNLLPPKPKSTFQHLQHGIQEFYTEIVGIPIGTNCAPLIADLILFCYEKYFMASLFYIIKKLKLFKHLKIYALVGNKKNDLV